MVKHVTSQELEQILNSESKTVFCDFWATWCGPCRMLAPIFEEVAKQYDGKAVFVKVNVDEEDCEAAAVKYGVTSIPNVIAFKDGKAVGNNLGFVPEAALTAFVEKYL